MTSLEKRLAKHFAPADIKAAREITPTRLSCPRVWQVRAIFKQESGETQEVFLELAAGRRGGMTLESRSTTQPGRAGRPCPLLGGDLVRLAINSQLMDRCLLEKGQEAVGPSAGLGGAEGPVGIPHPAKAPSSRWEEALDIEVQCCGQAYLLEVVAALQRTC